MKFKLIALAVIAASFGANATGSSNTQKQIDDLRDGLHQVHMNTLGKYSESFGLEDRANIGKLQADKLDKSAFTADQQRQDKALAATVTAQAARDSGQDQHINAVQDAAQSANVKADGLAVRADGIEQRAAVTDDRSIHNAVRLDGVETVNTQQSEAISQEARTRASQVVQLSAGIIQAQSTGDYAASRADQAFSNAAANSQSIRRTNERVAEHSAQLANHEQRITGLEQKTNRDFANMDKRLNNVRDGANAGVASVAAMASIPQVTEYQTFALGAGVGSRHDQQALAVGFSARAASNVVVKASVSTDTTDSITWGAGASIGW